MSYRGGQSCFRVSALRRFANRMPLAPRASLISRQGTMRLASIASSIRLRSRVFAVDAGAESPADEGIIARAAHTCQSEHDFYTSASVRRRRSRSLLASMSTPTFTMSIIFSALSTVQAMSERFAERQAETTSGVIAV